MESDSTAIQSIASELTIKVLRHICREQNFPREEQAVDYWLTLSDQQKVDLFHKALES